MPFSTNRVNLTPYVYMAIGERVLTSDEMMWLKSIEIVHNRKKADECKITFYNPILTYSDDKIFDYGSRVVVIAGWNDEFARKGPYHIKDIDWTFPPDGDPHFTLICKDPSASFMQAQPRSKKIVKDVLSVVRTFAKDNGLIPAMQMTEKENVLIDTVQRGETDAEFLQRVAGMTGFLWNVRGNTLYWVRPDAENPATYTLNYRTGDFSLKEFKPEIKATGGAKGKKKQPAKTVCAAQDPLDPDQQTVQEMYTKFKAGDTVAANVLINKIMREKAKLEGGGSPWGSKDTGDITNQIKKVVTDGLPQSILSDGAPVAGGRAGSNDSTVTGSGQKVFDYKADRFKDRVAGVQQTGLLDTITSGFEQMRQKADELLGNTTEIVRGDNTGASANSTTTTVANSVYGTGGMKGRLDKEAKLTVVSADMVPTIPSFLWEAKETVLVVGVSARLEGLYDIDEVTLTYDADNGLGTKLKGKKRLQETGAGAASVWKDAWPSANEQEQPQAAQGAASNPVRKAKALDRERRYYAVDGDNVSFQNLGGALPLSAELSGPQTLLTTLGAYRK